MFHGLLSCPRSLKAEPRLRPQLRIGGSCRRPASSNPRLLRSASWSSSFSLPSSVVPGDSRARHQPVKADAVPQPRSLKAELQLQLLEPTRPANPADGQLLQVYAAFRAAANSSAPFGVHKTSYDRSSNPGGELSPRTRSSRNGPSQLHLAGQAIVRHQLETHRCGGQC